MDTPYTETTDMAPDVAPDVVFIGLGQMGLPMALNLVRAGLAVAGHDLSAAALDRFAAQGGRALRGQAGLEQAVPRAPVLITMLPAGRQVEALYLGPGGLLARAAPGALLLDCSTIAAHTARRVAEAAAMLGRDFLDAPVSGGTAGAAQGTLTFMVGGTDTALERARPTLEKMGQAIFHAGAAGAGQAAKACNNMLLGIQMIGTAEALQLGLAQGLDAAVLSAIMARSSGRNWVLEQYNPCPGVMPQSPASRGYRGGFAVDLMLKDLGLAQEAALAAGACTPLGGLARQLYALHSQGGEGALDFSSIFERLGIA